VVTTIGALSGENSFKYNDKKMTYEKFKMFSMFRYGIPTNTDKPLLKDNLYNASISSGD